MTVIDVLALLAIGGLAGFINVLSAGGSMLTLPLLMFLGLPPQVANGTNRVAITLQSITAVGGFHRMGHGNLVVSLHLAVPAVLGSLLGAWVATWVADAVRPVGDADTGVDINRGSRNRHGSIQTFQNPLCDHRRVHQLV